MENVNHNQSKANIFSIHPNSRVSNIWNGIKNVFLAEWPVSYFDWPGVMSDSINIFKLSMHQLKSVYQFQAVISSLQCQFTEAEIHNGLFLEECIRNYQTQQNVRSCVLCWKLWKQHVKIKFMEELTKIGRKGKSNQQKPILSWCW